MALPARIPAGRLVGGRLSRADPRFRSAPASAGRAFEARGVSARSTVPFAALRLLPAPVAVFGAETGADPLRFSPACQPAVPAFAMRTATAPARDRPTIAAAVRRRRTCRSTAARRGRPEHAVAPDVSHRAARSHDRRTARPGGGELAGGAAGRRRDPRAEPPERIHGARLRTRHPARGARRPPMTQSEQPAELQPQQPHRLARHAQAHPQGGGAGDREQHPAEQRADRTMAGDQRARRTGVSQEERAHREQRRPRDR